MGSFLAKLFDSRPFDRDVNRLQFELIDLLLRLSPDIPFTLAVDDEVIFDICKKHDVLRRSCISAALKKYHTEKFFYDEVYDRTAKYVVMLDELLQIEQEIERKKNRKMLSLKRVYWLLYCKKDRIGDAGSVGELDDDDEPPSDGTEETATTSGTENNDRGGDHKNWNLED